MAFVFEQEFIFGHSKDWCETECNLLVHCQNQNKCPYDDSQVQDEVNKCEMELYKYMNALFYKVSSTFRFALGAVAKAFFEINTTISNGISNQDFVSFFLQ